MSNADDRFDAIWPQLAERPVPQVEGLPILSNQDMERVKIQALYGKAEEPPKRRQSSLA